MKSKKRTIGLTIYSIVHLVGKTAWVSWTYFEEKAGGLKGGAAAPPYKKKNRKLLKVLQTKVLIKLAQVDLLKKKQGGPHTGS